MIKPRPFMSSVVEISAGEAGEIPGLPETVSYWTEGASSAEEWFEEVNSVWGTAGFTVRRGDESLGYALYAPAEYLPRASKYPLGDPGDDAALLAYVCGDARTRRHLLVRSLRELRSRGLGGAEAIACDPGHPHHITTRFLLESGWRPVRRGHHAGRFYTRARVDLKSTVEVTGFARELIERIKIPRLIAPAPHSFYPARISPRDPKELTETRSRS